MTLSREPDEVNEVGQRHARKITEDQAEEEGAGSAVELNAPQAHDDPLADPAQEEGERAHLDGPGGGQGQPDGMERPPGETRSKDGQNNHQSAADAEEAPPLEVRDAAAIDR